MTNVDRTPPFDWQRIYPYSSHRWHMGLRKGDVKAFFERGGSAGDVLAERSRWLREDAETYSVLTDQALPALAETIALARDLGVRIDPDAPPAEQLRALGRAWEPDFVWMHSGLDGLHRLTGGVVCFPSGWALREKFGRTMAEIHAPVPGLNAVLAESIETFLSRQRPGEAWQRENANFARDGSLNHHPARPRRRIDASIRIDEMWLRLEHQLLLKLPGSGSIPFAIRVETCPLERILHDASAAQKLAAVFATMSEEAAVYKGIADAREILLEMCGKTGV